jgi:hypothetical protein
MTSPDPSPGELDNNVEVDDRGYMHILELTGPARDIADWQAAVR